MALWLKTNLGSRGNAREYWNACAFQEWPGTHKDFWLGLGCIVSPRTDLATDRIQWHAEQHSEFQTVKGLRISSRVAWITKELKTKLSTTVSTMLVLGTLGNSFSNLVMQKSYGIRLWHQNQNKTLISRNPFHYWYPSKTGCPTLWQVNFLGSCKTTLAE
jgi:hypothetical protein